MPSPFSHLLTAPFSKSAADLPLYQAQAKKASLFGTSTEDLKEKLANGDPLTKDEARTLAEENLDTRFAFYEVPYGTFNSQEEYDTFTRAGLDADTRFFLTAHKKRTTEVPEKEMMRDAYDFFKKYRLDPERKRTRSLPFSKSAADLRTVLQRLYDETYEQTKQASKFTETYAGAGVGTLLGLLANTVIAQKLYDRNATAGHIWTVPAVSMLAGVGAGLPTGMATNNPFAAAGAGLAGSLVAGNIAQALTPKANVPTMGAFKRIKEKLETGEELTESEAAMAARVKKFVKAHEDLQRKRNVASARKHLHKEMEEGFV